MGVDQDRSCCLRYLAQNGDGLIRTGMCAAGRIKLPRLSGDLPDETGPLDPALRDDEVDPFVLSRDQPVNLRPDTGRVCDVMESSDVRRAARGTVAVIRVLFGRIADTGGVELLRYSFGLIPAAPSGHIGHSH